jgi:hypothetical protein
MVYGDFLNHYCTNGMPSCRFSRRLWIVTRSVDLAFSRISTPNLKCHSTWKLCSSIDYTTIWVNLNCLGEIWITRKKFRVTEKGQRGFMGFWLGFWPRVSLVDKSLPKCVIKGGWWCFRGHGPCWPSFEQSQPCLTRAFRLKTQKKTWGVTKSTGKTGHAWVAQDEHHLRVNSPKSNSRSPDSLHGFA